MSTVPFMEPATWEALQRLIKVARQDTHQARYCANFLMAWWNAKELGGFDPTDLWGVDEDLNDAMILVFSFIARHSVYPSEYTFGAEIEEIVRLWRPEMFAADGVHKA